MDLMSIQTTTSFTVETSVTRGELDLRPAAGVKVKSIWLVDEHIKNAFTVWAIGCLSIILCSIGTAGNIINVIVFCKMGFKETMNISFIGLAIADIGCLLTQIWLGVQNIPPFRDLANWLLPFDPADPVFRNATAAWPHICFLRITGLVTAHATLVRCLCIAMPLQVKTMLTPGRSLAVIVSIFLSMFAVFSPVVFGSPIGWKFSPTRNRTIIMQLGVDNKAEQITYGLSNVCGYVSFFVVIVCTSVLITNLRRKAKWREGVTGYQNLFFVTFCFTFNLEAINSSVNILIYLNMSSKYKAIFDAMFNRGENTPEISGRV
ncbi:chemosensory receptor A [Elysia marginata]|uniref:Chemosensory receptor A n=1 Tax=Elysia marginata TaxID=1093978 RepID=A0AAV4HPZ3_9GAST|nr:chemosensory receptor A [Elysia marginata]